MTRWSRALLAFLLPATAAAVLTTTATPAAADFGTVSRHTVTSPVVFSTTTTAIKTTTINLAAGQSIHVRGRLEATSNVTYNVGMNDTVRCLNAQGTQQGIAALSARNHEGYDATSYAIPGHLPIYADLLFVAPTTGTYTCGMWAVAYSSGGTGFRLTAVATSSWIELSNQDQVGSHWWQNPVCASNGTSPTCTYVGAGTSSSYVFYNDGTPVYTWTAAPTATSVSVAANLEVTTCYTGTGSCKSAIAPYERPVGTNATFSVRLDVIQLDPTAHTCVTTSTTAKTLTAADAAHHYVTYLSLPSVPISAACGTRTFIMRVFVSHVSGNPIKIDGVQNSSSLTNGMMLNLF